MAAAGTAEERAADAAASALLAGRSTTFSGSVRGAGTDRQPVLQRYMAWEHSMLGDLDPVQVGAAADGEAAPVAGYRDLLAELGRAPRRAGAERLRAAHPGLDLVRLRGSGLVVTLGELNVLPDYLGRPEDIESAPLTFIGPLIQSVRSWSVAELARPAGVAGSRGPVPVTLPRLLPGSLRYPLLGPLAETAEIAAVSKLGRRHGFAPEKRYSAVLARNSGHFAPFSWYRWRAFHLAARELIARSATETGAERAALRLRARTWAGYADHFLQDSFAAGHLVNKTLVIQWYIEWLAASGVSYPGRDVLDTLTVARQPLLHGPRLYDRAAARAGGVADTRPGAVAGPPGPTRDAQDVADAGTLEERIAASGVVGDCDAERRAAYAAYLAMLGSGTVQLAVKVAHEYLNAHSLAVSAGPLGPAFRLNGDHTLLTGPAGALRAAEAAAASRRAIAELLRDGETSIDSWDIVRPLPRPRGAGRATGLAPAVAPGGAAGPVPRAVRAAHRRERCAASCPAPSDSVCCPPATRYLHRPSTAREVSGRLAAAGARRACRLRQRQEARSVAYAIGIVYRCRWRRRQVGFEVAGVADRWRLGRRRRRPPPRLARPSAGWRASAHRPHRHHAQQAGRILGSSWGLRVAGCPQRHTLTRTAGERGPQQHTVMAPAQGGSPASSTAASEPAAPTIDTALSRRRQTRRAGA